MQKEKQTLRGVFHGLDTHRGMADSGRSVAPQTPWSFSRPGPPERDMDPLPGNTNFSKKTFWI